MTKLSIFRGLPASGKSTEAKRRVKESNYSIVRVNRDDIRTMLHEGIFIAGVTEQDVIFTRDSIIRAALKAGKHVISDDTNLKANVVKELAEIAIKHNAEIEVVDFNVDVETCIERDSQREGRACVGKDVIMDMYNRFVRGGFPKNPLNNLPKAIKMIPYTPDVTKPSAFIFDIDGTCSEGNGRSMYDYTQVHTDLPHEDVINLAKILYKAGYNLIFMSGREDSCYESTAKWLNDHLNLPNDYGNGVVGQGIPLYMRVTDDRRNDSIVKYELFDEHVRNNYNVLGVFDDRQKVVDMWRKINLRCYQVNYGDF